MRLHTSRRHRKANISAAIYQLNESSGAVESYRRGTATPEEILKPSVTLNYSLHTLNTLTFKTKDVKFSWWSVNGLFWTGQSEYIRLNVLSFFLISVEESFTSWTYNSTFFACNYGNHVIKYLRLRTHNIREISHSQLALRSSYLL